MSEDTTQAQDTFDRYDNSDVPYRTEDPYYDNQHANATLVKFGSKPIKAKGGEEVVGESFVATLSLEEPITNEEGEVTHPGREIKIEKATMPPSDWKDADGTQKRAFVDLLKLGIAAGTAREGMTKKQILESLKAAVGKQVRLSFKVNAGKKANDDGTFPRYQNIYFAKAR